MYERQAWADIGVERGWAYSRHGGTDLQYPSPVLKHKNGAGKGHLLHVIHFLVLQKKSRKKNGRHLQFRVMQLRNGAVLVFERWGKFKMTSIYFSLHPTNFPQNIFPSLVLRGNICRFLFHKKTIFLDFYLKKKKHFDLAHNQNVIFLSILTPKYIFHQFSGNFHHQCHMDY